MTPEQEKDLAVRAKRAHERMHGQSTWIEARYMSHIEQVRVADHELGIVTYWRTYPNERRKIAFDHQLGERS